MNRGYVMLWRKHLDSPLMRNAELWQLMSYLLMRATHKQHKQLVGKQVIELNPGQLIFGRRATARDLDSSEQKIRTALKTLEKLEFITVKTTNKFSIVTIVSWGTYQQDQPAINQQSTSNQPATNQQSTTNKNIKNIKNIKKEESQIASDDTPLAGESLEAKKKVEEFDEDSVPYRLAVFYREELKKAPGTLRDPNLQSWAKDFDVALRNDPRMKDPAIVARVIQWTCQDSFWATNCRSPATLRKQFDRLTAGMEVEKARVRSSPKKERGYLTLEEQVEKERLERQGVVQ